MRYLLLVLMTNFAALTDRDALAIYAELLNEVTVRGEQREAATFLVRDGDGRIRSVPWGSNGDFRSAHFKGTVPTGTIAIAHTHPNGWDQPSRNDIAQAKRIGIAIIVVTRCNVNVVLPDGSIVPLIQRNRIHGRGDVVFTRAYQRQGK